MKKLKQVIPATSLLIVLTIASVYMLINPPVACASTCAYTYDAYKRFSWDGFNCYYFTRYCLNAMGGVDVGYEHDCGINFW